MLKSIEAKERSEKKFWSWYSFIQNRWALRDDGFHIRQSRFLSFCV